MTKQPTGLVDRHGKPLTKDILTQEIAGPSLTGVRSVITGYPGDGLTPRRLASLLREADAGEPLRYFELAEQIEERDLHYAGVLGTRKRSVSQIDITVEAASDDKDDVARADIIRDWLTRDELQDELFDILDAIGKGVSLTEIVWDSSEGQWRPERLEWRDPRWFRFDRIDGRTPMLRTETGDIDLPPMKFITASIKAKSGLPVRSGLSRLAAWAWMFKAFTLRDWAIFTQTYGQPVRVGRYGAGATEDDKETLFRAVANIAGDCAAIIPESMTIDFVEAANLGSGSDLYEKRADWYDRQVSKATLGQTATTDAEVGGLGSGKEHRQVQEDIERADAKALSAILNRDLTRPWIDLEFGPQKRYPRIRIARPEKEDVQPLVSALTSLVPMGLRVQASEVRDKLGLADPEEGAEVLSAPAAPALFGQDLRGYSPALQAAASGARLRLPPGAAGAGRGKLQLMQESGGATPADMIAEALARRADPEIAKWIATLEAMVNRAGSLDELREMIASGFPDLDADGFAQALGEAMEAADAAGRFDVEEESA